LSVPPKALTGRVGQRVEESTQPLSVRLGSGVRRRCAVPGVRRTLRGFCLAARSRLHAPLLRPRFCAPKAGGILELRPVSSTLALCGNCRHDQDYPGDRGFRCRLRCNGYRDPANVRSRPDSRAPLSDRAGCLSDDHGRSISAARHPRARRMAETKIGEGQARADRWRRRRRRDDYERASRQPSARSRAGRIRG
jgi:hypothetical protein